MNQLKEYEYVSLNSFLKLIM